MRLWHNKINTDTGSWFTEIIYLKKPWKLILNAWQILGLYHSLPVLAVGIIIIFLDAFRSLQKVQQAYLWAVNRVRSVTPVWTPKISMTLTWLRIHRTCSFNCNHLSPHSPPKTVVKTPGLGQKTPAKLAQVLTHPLSQLTPNPHPNPQRSLNRKLQIHKMTQTSQVLNRKRPWKDHFGRHSPTWSTRKMGVRGDDCRPKANPLKLHQSCHLNP